jgi:hypothetical protein
MRERPCNEGHEANLSNPFAMPDSSASRNVRHLPSMEGLKLLWGKKPPGFDSGYVYTSDEIEKANMWGGTWHLLWPGPDESPEKHASMTIKRHSASPPRVSKRDLEGTP